VLDALVQIRRDKAATKHLLRTLMKRQARAPRVMVTDTLKSYGAAERAIIPPGSSIGSTRASTTRAENSHQPTRRRERQRKRFKSPRQVRRFLSIRDLIANLFHFRRDRISAADYRAARTQAFEAWAEVAGAGMGQQVDGADEISKPNQYLHRSRRRSLCKRSHMLGLSPADETHDPARRSPADDCAADRVVGALQYLVVRYGKPCRFCYVEGARGDQHFVKIAISAVVCRAAVRD
jgi:putative transposase